VLTDVPGILCEQTNPEGGAANKDLEVTAMACFLKPMKMIRAWKTSGQEDKPATCFV
jgi:hypothetical protein